SAAEDRTDRLRRGRVVTRRLRNAGQQRGLVGIIGSKSGQRPTEIVFRCPRKSVLTIAHVDEARIPGEDFFFRAAFRYELLAHLVLDPQREPTLFALPQPHVDVPRADPRRQDARQDPCVSEPITVLLRRLSQEKHAPHELLGDGGPTLREDRAAGHVVPPSTRRQPCAPRAGPY